MDRILYSFSTMATYTHNFDTPAYKGVVTVNTGLFIDNNFIEPLAKETIE
jgi:aldehyde dehydrogenase (NAD+)